MKTNTKKSSRRAGDTLVMVLTVTTGILLAVLTFFFFKAEQVIRNDGGVLENIERMQVATLIIERDTSLAMDGKEKGFIGVRQAEKDFIQLLGWLKSGNMEKKISKIDDSLSEELAVIDEEWSRLKTSIDTVLSAEDSIRVLYSFSRVVNEIIPALVGQSRQTVADLVASKKVNLDTLKFASEQQFLAQRIATDFNILLNSDRYSIEDIENALVEFTEDSSKLEKIVTGLLKGDKSLGIKPVKNTKIRVRLQEIDDLFQTLKSALDTVKTQLPQLLAAEAAINADDDVIGQLNTHLTELGEVFDTLAHDRLVLHLERYGLFVAIAFFILSAVATRLNQKKHLQDVQERETKVARENASNQEAILRLLDEIAGLGDGDLSRNATVTEDITGSIADAFNYAIDELRSLVNRINDTSNLVTTAAKGTQSTSAELAEISTQQAAQIASVTDGIKNFAEEIMKLSNDADESTKVAKESVDKAKEGGQAVRNTINGMESIRGQIQETSKRIKRLGESSQEIGEIVGLIHDISEQTNLLALNAAIQAAMAGEAGRGFAVVADEVQHLAERSTNATKQIEKLVKTIQSDTNEAVLSMEKSTYGVVDGTRLAQDAGNTLEQIESMFDNIAERIHNMSSAANKQVENAMAVNETMNVIHNVTTQTSTGIDQTAESVGKLAELSDELRFSVSGFKLPAVKN